MSLLRNLICAELRAGFHPLADAREGVALLAERDCRITNAGGIIVVDRAGNPRIKNGQGDPMTLADLLDEIRRTRPALFAPDKNDSAPSTPSTPAFNPFRPESENLTAQMRLYKTNPALAAKLKREAAEPTSPLDRNPWIKGPGFSVTKQMAMIRDDPASATAMAKIAGVDLRRILSAA